MFNPTLKKLSLVTLFSFSLLSLQGCVTAAVVGTAAAVGVATKVATDPRSTGTQIDDETLEEKISYRLNKDAQLNEEARIEVIAYNGEALLVGQALTNDSVQNATNIAQGVDGVKKVHNYIRLGSKITMSRIAKDSLITTKIKAKLVAETTIKSADIKVLTENAEVFLMGNVTNDDANVATHIARYTPGVKKVILAFSYK